MEPRIVHSELTGQWYIVTRYSLRRGKDEKHAMLVAHKKYEVTAQMEDLLQKHKSARRKRSVAVNLDAARERWV